MRCDQYGRRFGHSLRKEVTPMPIILTLHVFGLTVHIVGLLAVIRRKRPAYRRCTPEATAENILNREFTANAVNKKWCTDVTEMKYGARGEKAYLSAILDLKSRDIVSFAIGRHNNNQLVFETFNWQSRSTQMHTHCFIVTGASSTRASSSRTCWKNRECGKACLVLADALTMVRWRASGAS